MQLDDDIISTGQIAIGGFSNTGGGSGGSIWLKVTGNINGTADLYADGGSTNDATAGVGGGGRIRYECGGGGWTGTTYVRTGGPAPLGNLGADGTVIAPSSLQVSAPTMVIVVFG